MVQSKVVILVLVGIVVIGGGYFLLQPKGEKVSELNATQEEDGSSKEQVRTTEEVGTVPQPSGKKMPFSEFIKGGGSYTCTVNQYVNDTEMKGTTYISGGMVRGEYTVAVQGMNITSSMIVRDGYTYSWSSMMPTMGYKAKVVESTETSANAGMSGTYSWNAEQIGDYECTVWSPDESQFEIPTEITFTEVS